MINCFQNIQINDTTMLQMSIIEEISELFFFFGF